MGKVADALRPKEDFAVDAAGNPVALQEHQVQAAHEAGFTPVTGQYAGELQGAQENKDYVDENYGVAGKAALGGLSGLTLGLGPAALSRMGLLDKGHLEAAGETAPYMAGDVAGMLLPAFLSGGESVAARGATGLASRAGSVIGRALEATPAGLLGRAGGAAERLAGHFLPEAGIMGKLATPTISMAARGATEGAIVNLSHTVADNVIQNKPLAAQALLASGVDGALFGGLTGGILGGISAAAGAGVDVVGGRIASGSGGAGAEAKAGTALKRLGATEANLAKLAEREGDLVTPLKGYYKVLQDGGETLASDTSAIRRAVQGAETKYGKIAEDAIETLQRESPSVLDGRLSNLEQRITRDITESHGLTYGYGAANSEAEAINSRFGNMRRPIEGAPSPAGYSGAEPVPPKWLSHTGDWDSYQQALSKHELVDMPAFQAAKAAHDAAEVSRVQKEIKALIDKDGGTWKGWAKSREQLADAYHASSGTRKDVLKTALNAFDDELQGAMQRANPELATQWAAATTGQRQARELLTMTGKKVASEASRGSSLHMNGADAATFGYSVLAGANPLVGAGIIAGKKLVSHTQRVMEPAVAEAAYRSAIGANAAHAQVAVGQRISSTLKSFMTGARMEGSAMHAKSTRPSYTMGNFQKSMDMADELTSAAHQAKVREMTTALATAGHAELAQEMASTYGRAVAYINQNKPKGHSKEAKMGSLGKAAKSVGLTTQGMKFMRQIHAMTQPMDSIMGGLERGDVSRDAVAAVKYVFPALHQDIVLRASQQIMDMKAQGKFLPADKVALTGVVLDSPVDSKLEKGFIDEVQQGLAANKAPQKEQQNGPPPVTDVSQYQTPLQSTV